MSDNEFLGLINTFIGYSHKDRSTLIELLDTIDKGLESQRLMLVQPRTAVKPALKCAKRRTKRTKRHNCNGHKHWTDLDIIKVSKMLMQGKKLGAIAREMHRSRGAISFLKWELKHGKKQVRA